MKDVSRCNSGIIDFSFKGGGVDPNARAWLSGIGNASGNPTDSVPSS